MFHRHFAPVVTAGVLGLAALTGDFSASRSAPITVREPAAAGTS